LWIWNGLPGPLRRRVKSGSELLVIVPLLLLGVGVAFSIAPAVENALFGGDVRQWLLTTFGWTYDQRNSLVVGVAMGFAVIPIIFTISEDAFSSVPASLSAASLALGASRWQTAMRVVIPTASPGVFSAIMVGFGRAVGETMIVLMATGNTPVMDWSIFNGFRTLSANIAVEIPEAPQGGTLYRTLFLAAALLFAMTFTLNTIAEVVRQRLRDRYKAV
jgi:phosphate transport system permease protein